MIALLLAVLLVISLAACGNNEANESAYNTSEQSETGTSSREDETDSGNSSAQSDIREADSENTAISWDTDLALALEAYGAEVDFETVWDQGHTQAERTGKGTENLIDWINSLWS